MKKTKLAIIFTSLILLMSIAGSLLFLNNVTGTIRLFKTAITINFKDNVYIYNDEDLDTLNYTISDGNLFSGDKIKFYFKTKFNNAKTYSRNDFSYSIISETGKDVTSSYIINENFEDIVINKREIAIKTVSTAGTLSDYKANRIAYKKFSIEKGTLCAGHSLTATSFKSFLTTGNFDNTCIATVLNSNNSDVTKNYDISIYTGTVFVLPDTSSSSSDKDKEEDKDKEDDKKDEEIVTPDKGSIGLNSDEEETVEGYSDTLVDLNYTVFQYYKDTKGNHFLRDNASKGTYSINKFLKSPKYTISEDNINPDEFITYLLKDLVSHHSGTIDYSMVASRNYDFHLNYPIYNVKQDNDLYPILSDLKTNELKVEGLNYDYMKKPSLLDNIQITDSKFIEEEKAYRQFVYENYLGMDQVNYNFIKQYIKDKNLSGDSVYEIANKLIKLFKNEFKYSKQKLECYKEQYKLISFLNDTHIGKCTEFAAASTLIFRVLGYPARVITGFSVNGIGKVNVLAAYRHAKTQVYFDGKGWVDFEFTVAQSIDKDDSPWMDSGDDDDEEEQEYDIKISSETLVKEYDGTPLTSTSFEIEGEDKLKEGHKLYAFCNNSIIDAGVVDNKVDYFILDSSLNDVTSKYKIFDDFGELQITKKSFEITTNDCKVYFDNQINGRGYSWINNDLAEGDEIYNAELLEYKERGTYQNIIVVKIRNKNGIDVSSNYDIQYNYGTIEVV